MYVRQCYLYYIVCMYVLVCYSVIDACVEVVTYGKGSEDSSSVKRPRPSHGTGTCSNVNVNGQINTQPLTSSLRQELCK